MQGNAVLLYRYLVYQACWYCSTILSCAFRWLKPSRIETREAFCSHVDLTGGCDRLNTLLLVADSIPQYGRELVSNRAFTEIPLYIKH